jgi:starch phosphorylase
MSTKNVGAVKLPAGSEGMSTLLKQYGCGPVEFTGTDNALYERHLLFDNVVHLAAADPRDRYEAFARSVRDILSQRWVRTEETYERANPKRAYYLSMEFLIGRSLANNVTNLLLDPIAPRAAEQKHLDWLSLLEEEPDAGLGNGGLGRLAACFIDSMATIQLPTMGYGLRYEYGIFHQGIRDGWQHGPGSGRALPGADRGVRLLPLCAHRRTGDAGAEGPPPEVVARSGHGIDARRGAHHRQADARPG